MRYILIIALLFNVASAQSLFGVVASDGKRLLLDGINQTPIGAYSLRKLTKNYSGSAVRVRRSSDNTEQDIGFVNNEIDTASLKTFVGSGDGFVVTLYNQVASNNLGQSTQSNQPYIVESGVVVRENGRVGIKTSSTRWLQSADYSALNGTATASMNTAHRNLNYTSSYNIFAGFGLYQLDFQHSTVNLQVQWDIGGVNSTTASGTAQNATIFAIRNAGANEAYINGGSAGTSSATYANFTNAYIKLYFGRRVDGGNVSTNCIYEQIFWDVALSSTNRTTIRDNQRTYYSLY